MAEQWGVSIKGGAGGAEKMESSELEERRVPLQLPPAQSSEVTAERVPTSLEKLQRL